MTATVEEREEGLTAAELREMWDVLSGEERAEGFRLLRRTDQEDFYLEASSRDQMHLLSAVPPGERRSWLRLLPPDDAADVLQLHRPEEREQLVALLDETSRREVSALLAYAEDDAGGLMNPRFARIRPDMKPGPLDSAPPSTPRRLRGASLRTGYARGERRSRAELVLAVRWAHFRRAGARPPPWVHLRRRRQSGIKTAPPAADRR